MPPREGLTKDELKDLERKLPNTDPLPDKLGIKSHYGSIEAAEEKRFPWLRDRRRRRRRA